MFTALLALLAAAASPTAASAVQIAPASAAKLDHITAAREFKRAQVALRADHDRFVNEIIQLTEIPSPPFGEEPKGQAFANLMRKSGIDDVTIDGIGNVVATRPGTNSNLPPLIVAAHLDTVFPKGTDVTVRRVGTKLMAPGVGDDTRGLAVLLTMARAMSTAMIKTERDIIFVGNVGEEGPGDLRGMRYLFKNNPRARAAAGFISIDSSGADVVATRGVGSLRYHVVFSGPGGHSFDKFGIVNPMVSLAKTIIGLYSIPVPSEPKTTYSASVIGGGTSVNTIPPKVYLDIDMRSVSPAELERVDREFRAIVARAVAEENATRSTERGTISAEIEKLGDRPAGSTNERLSLVADAMAASRHFGYAPKFIAVSTDANIPMNLGIPAIAIGSGGTGGAEHSPDEWIDVEINESVRGISVAMATVLAAAGQDSLSIGR